MITAIICELNPLHRGHEYLINEAKKKGSVVLIMSGNFCQRGSSAVYQKYERAKAGVLCGADLVVELPFPWCSAGAADFARAGVFIAHSLGCDAIMFGSSCGDGDLLRRAGELFHSNDFDRLYREEETLSPGIGAAVLRERILYRLIGDDAKRLSEPNDILGVEYYRYAAAHVGIECCPVKRIEGEGVLSASELRLMLSSDHAADAREYIPERAHGSLDRFLPEKALYDTEQMIFRYKDFDPERFAEASGGVGYRIINAARSASDGEEMLALAATKKFTSARLRRAALYMSLEVTRENVKSTPAFTSVLAIGSGGRDILRGAANRAEITILTKPSASVDGIAAEQYAVQCRADRLYTMLGARRRPGEFFMTCTPYIQK